MSNLSKIRIKNLFGSKTYEILLTDNRLILVAENGSGKTTIVNIIYYFLSRQWSRLLKYNFESITATINNREFTLYRANIDISKSERVQKYLKRFPAQFKETLQKLLPEFEARDLFRHPDNIEKIANLYDIPSSFLYDFFSNFRREQESLFSGEIKELSSQLNEAFVFKILYLPTYRRIEQELQNVFPGIEEDMLRFQRKNRPNLIRQDLNYIELVEFGMEDVVKVINTKLKQVRDNFNFNLQNNLTGGYLKSVINKEYNNIKYDLQNFSESIFNKILEQIDEKILAEREKEKLREFIITVKAKADLNEEDKIISYFIFKLLEIFKVREKEEKTIMDFILICNDYLSNKTLVYDNFEIKICVPNNDTIEFRDLSSGEKQIISLFSQLYLTNKSRNFIIIDEPELSLSVKWQRKILMDICNSGFCDGLLAVTHSPFIFENSLESFAHSLNEFEVINK